MINRKIKAEKLALKCVEIHRAFYQSPSLSVAEYHFPLVMQIGSTIRYANMIQGRNIIEREQLYALGTILNMNRVTTDSSLKILDELDIIDIENDKNGQITSIEERIPETSQVLSNIGKILIKSDVTSIKTIDLDEKEKAVLQILEI